MLFKKLHKNSAAAHRLKGGDRTKISIDISTMTAENVHSTAKHHIANRISVQQDSLHAINV